MAAPLTIALLATPRLVAILFQTLPDPGAWPLWIVVALAAALIAFIFRGVYQNNRGGVTRRAWAYGFRWTALIETVGGAWVLVTGRTPTKMGSSPVPRSDSIYYFLLALGMWLIGQGLIAWEARQSHAEMR